MQVSTICCTLQGVCVTAAALIQYFLMAAFCWMLVEGIYLYLFVVKVYNVSSKMKICHGFSWGKCKEINLYFNFSDHVGQRRGVNQCRTKD